MFLRRAPCRFEVIVEAKGRASIDGVFDDEKSAVERARYLLAQARFTAVRVSRVNGAGKEETVFEKSYSGGGKVTTISPVDEANVCGSVYDVYSFESRKTLLRLLRAYWDEQQVIPAEQLHRYYPLRYLEREAVLFNPAVSRLAVLQAPRLGVTVFNRQDTLLRMFVQIKELAQKGDELAAFDRALMTGGTAGLTTAVAAAIPSEERDRAITHAFAAALEQNREWRSKVGTLLRFHDPMDGESARLVDQFVAETVDGREPIRALIGYSPDLASAILSLTAALRGELDDRLPHTDEMLDLSNAVAHGTFPNTETAILNRIAGALDGTSPLTRQGKAADGKAFGVIAGKLVMADGFRGGGPIAVALTRRGKMAMGQNDRDLPFEETVVRLCAKLATAPAQIGFLLDLASTSYGRRRMSFLLEQVATLFAGVRSAEELAPAGVPAVDIRRRYEERLRAANVPKVLADALVARIAAMPDVVDPNTPRSIMSIETLDLKRKPEPRLLISFAGRRHILPEDGSELLIGRGHDCQILLDLASASRHHAKLTAAGGEFRLEDLSRNGTDVKVGVAPVRTLGKGESVRLVDRGEILIGSPGSGETVARIAWDVQG